jgi:oxygen-independent coproporphyrinogen-3 oxidase
VERLSLGLQSLDDEALAFLGRNHAAAEARQAMALAARTFPRLSADLIYARPGQDLDAWAGELAAVSDMGAGHISPYQLTIETGTAFDRAVRRGRLRPLDPELAAAFYETTQSILERLGYEAYEISNHARGEAARSRHNLLYWRGEDFVGVGPGAHGRLTLADGRHATRAAAGVRDYIRAVAQTGRGWAEDVALGAREAAEERLLMGLRTVEGVALGELAPLPLAATAELEAAGLVRTAGGRLFATAAGRPVLDRVIAELAG